MRKKLPVLAIKPKIDYHDAKHAYFIHSGMVYAVATAPSSIFKAAVLERLPNWLTHDEYGPILKQDTLELYDRWFLLCEMRYAPRKLQTYKSRDEAERECRQVG